MAEQNPILKSISTVADVPAEIYDRLTNEISAAFNTAVSKRREAAAMETANREQLDKLKFDAASADTALKLNMKQRELEASNRMQDQMQILNNDKTRAKINENLNKAYNEAIVDINRVMELDNVTIKDNGFFPWLGAQIKKELSAKPEAENTINAVKQLQVVSAAQTAASDETKQFIVNSTKTMTEGDMALIENKLTAELQASALERSKEGWYKDAENAAAIANMRADEITALGSINRQQATTYALNMERMTSAEKSRLANITLEKVGSTQRYTPEQIAIFEKDPQALPQLNYLIREGHKAENNISDAAVGESFSDSISLMQTFQPETISKDTPVNRATAEIVNRVTANKKFQGNTPEAVYGRNQEINDLIKEYEKKYAAEIEPGDTKNFYKAQPYDVIKDYQVWKDSELNKKVFSHLGLEGKPLDESLLFRSMAGAIENGNIDRKQAVNEMATMFQQVVRVNNSLNGFLARHMSPQTSYNAVIRMPGTLPHLTPTEVVNLASETQIDKALNTYFNNIKSERVFKGFKGMN